MDNINLDELAEEKIDLGRNLLISLSKFDCDGVKKLQKKVNQEIKFLEKQKNGKSLKLNHINSSNLVHFASLVQCLQVCKDVKHVDYPVAMEDRDGPLRIDIVCDNGASWIKAIARNPKSLNDSVLGRTNYGTKNILEQAEEFIEAAQDNLYMYKPPRVIFYFANLIDVFLIEKLENLGIIVKFSRDVENNRNADSNINDINTLNLDITALIAFVSSLTNGSPNFIFREGLLSQQAEWERKSPAKPVLDALFDGKRLICCKTAVNSFNEILDFIAGPKEKERAEKFMSLIEILPDVDEIPDNLRNLKLGGKIKTRSLQIFAFGIVHKAITVTSNDGFVRAAKMQNVDIPVFIHEARALTEEKESTATKINDSQCL